MNAKQVNLALWSGAIAFSIAAIGSLVLGFAMPLREVEIVGSIASLPTIRREARNPLPSLAAFETVWSATLRQPLGDPPPLTPVAPTPVANAPPSGVIAVQPSNIPVSLVGTIGTSLAIFKTPGNAVEVCGMGESAAGVTVVAVRPSEVDVRFNGQVMTLQKPAEK